MKPQDLKVLAVVKKGDYYYLRIPDHPRSTRHGYVLQHRFVMESHLNRFLLPLEIVHHKNGDKKDNRIENLSLSTSSAHSSYHARERVEKAWVKISCANCKKLFDRLSSKLSKGRNFCSHRCNMLYHIKIGLLKNTSVAEHGTVCRYSYHGCRCFKCRRGNRLRQREYRKRPPCSIG